jgi:hypothetical protein
MAGILINDSVGDGFLHLRSNSRVDSIDEVEDSIRDVWVNSAAVSYNKRIARPGWYYETKMKTSNISMTSSFWFRMGDYSEIDVIEHMGNPVDRSKAMMEYRYGCNTHVYGKKRNEGFYHNGIKVMEVTPSAPFEENLHMIFDTEVFRWNGLPTIESLKDSTRNTMYVDYVRAFKLEDHNIVD